jgi:hypothetical protein
MPSPTGFDYTIYIQATQTKWRAEPLSRVSVDIEDVGNGMGKLALVHDDFETGSEILPAVSGMAGRPLQSENPCRDGRLAQDCLTEHRHSGWPTAVPPDGGCRQGL